MTEPIVPRRLTWYSSGSYRAVAMSPIRWSLFLMGQSHYLGLSISLKTLAQIEWRPGDKIDIAVQNGCLFLRQNERGKTLTNFHAHRAFMRFPLSGISGWPEEKKEPRQSQNAIDVWWKEKEKILIAQLWWPLKKR